jgi:hypothetical protein
MKEWTPVINIIAGIAIAVLTSWLTVQFALRRFRSEKWFERRLDAYTKIIESLHFMKRCTDRQLRAEEAGGCEIAREVQEEIVQMYNTGFADLRRLTDMGALVFSSEAVTVLDAVRQGLDAASEEQSSWAQLHAEAAAIGKCLKEIVPIAKRDLHA